MLHIQNLTKSFDGKIILKDLNLDVKKGETVTIIGPSGAGKSTFLRCIDLLEIPDQAQMQIDDVKVELPNITKKDLLAVRRKTAMVFQQYNLYKNKTALQNVTESLVLVKKMTKSKAHEVALQALKSVGMDERADAYPQQLSGGQQQRVGIARAAVIEPKMMLFDEPTSSLDPESINGILELIKRQHDEGRTMIVVTHEMRFARQVSDQIIVMENGHFIESGTPEVIFEDPKQQRTKDFLHQIN
ncbi:amino acid ABC transporter ATP-binding protein [Enterococcus hirae]|nr:amino acid ABC transporter ATP-binding protein [Enterococcus hirae]